MGGLIDRIARPPGMAAGKSRVTVDEDDLDEQSLLVWYPTATPVEDYVRQAIKIEVGNKPGGPIPTVKPRFGHTSQTTLHL
jgi:hypothetical protein